MKHRGAELTDDAVKSVSGFTLIEVLAVLLLTGVLVTAMASISGDWLRSWNRTAISVQSAELLSVALDRVTRDIETTIILPGDSGQPRSSFLGTRDSVRLVHPSVETPGSSLEIIDIKGGVDGSLTRSRARFDARTSLQDAPTGDAVVLLHASWRVSFAFLDAADIWQSSWSRPGTPNAVRVDLRSASGEQRPDLSPAVPIKASIPSICVAVTSLSSCEALGSGQPIGLPSNAETSTSRRRRRAP